jgi:hypothetical protein
MKIYGSGFGRSFPPISMENYPMKLHSIVALTIVLGLGGSSAWAGPYSPGFGGEAETGIKDAGIAGFVDGKINPIFVGWATTVVDYSPAPEVGAAWSDSSMALGPVTNDPFDVVSLGDMKASQLAAYWADPSIAAVKPGSITLSFEKAIANGQGADFVVFENSFMVTASTITGGVKGQIAAELAYVEVSTDGLNFARFPSDYLNFPDAKQASTSNNFADLTGTGKLQPVSYLSLDVSNIYNLAGKHVNDGNECWGTPFDLNDLWDDPLVISGLVDLNEIWYVRIVDIPGNGSFTDSNGNRIFDAWVTWDSGGFDLAGIGVINQQQIPEPATAGLLLIGCLGLLARRRKS